MPQIIENAIAENLSAWIAANRPAAIPTTVPVLLANRDEVRTRPCIVVSVEDSKSMPRLPNTAKAGVKFYLFSQIDDTRIEDHTAWASALANLLRDRAKLTADLECDTFILHDLLWRETLTSPDETRGRETVLTFEAVASAV